MFRQSKKKKESLDKNALKHLLSIESAEHLLSEEKRRMLLTEIQSSFPMDTRLFQQFCLNLIHHFTQYCQLLPETFNNYYIYPGGILDHALHRTEAALALFRQFAVQISPKEDYSPEQQRWQYALFSAAILQGIGKLCIDYHIKRYDAKGEMIDKWNPLVESLAAQGQSYHYEFEKEPCLDLRKRLNLLMAYRLIPEEGFVWISSDNEVLATWLALLNEDYASAGALGAILTRANAIALRRYFDQILLEHEHPARFHRASTFGKHTNESITAVEQKTGIEFIQWLSNMLESGEIMINQSLLDITPDGLLISPDAFKLFIKTHPNYKSWLAVQHGFLSLGLHTVHQNGEVQFRFAQENTQQMRHGLLIDMDHLGVLLPDTLHFYQMSTTGQAMTMSATDFIYQAPFRARRRPFANIRQPVQPTRAIGVLSANGKWQPELLQKIPVHSLEIKK